MALGFDDISINTLIGSGSKCTGDMSVAGFVRIDGDLEGNIETSGRIIIGESARILGNVYAKQVLVGGVVLGNIVAEKSATLFSTASLIGDLISPKVQIEQDVVFQGSCISLKDPECFEEAKKDWLTKISIEKRALSL